MSNVLTFDIDWAPDWAIDDCIDICRAGNVPATFFATHRSTTLGRLLQDPSFEVGIHPNFLPGSSHGSSSSEVLSFFRELVPGAVSMRTHALHQSTRIFSEVLEQSPRIRADVSLFLPGHPNLKPTLLFIGAQRPLIRFPYWWEDDVASYTPDWDWRPPSPSSDLRIFDFHPVHVALNMRSMTAYQRLKAATGGAFSTATRDDFKPFVERNLPGTATFLKELIERLGADSFTTVRDLLSGIEESERPVG
jgi:hypothetical protein